MRSTVITSGRYSRLLKGPALALSGACIAWTVDDSSEGLPELPSVSSRLVDHNRGSLWRPAVAYCEREQMTRKFSIEDAPYPSWIRRSLSYLRLASLPLPRVVIPGDPDLNLESRRIRDRQKSDRALADLQLVIQRTIREAGGDAEKKVGELLLRSYEILYGPDTHPQQRQAFLQQYGCTGWTEEVLITLLELGASRGFVEIGAGNGQWARILTDRYFESEYFSQHPKKTFEFCLAYDNMSALPLNPEVYHERTQPYHRYFYPNVQPCDSIDNVLGQWQCRGRVLLLVYPSPGNGMAADALKAYADVSPLNDTVVYVGEGRGGANANDAFFDCVESGEWILSKIIPVHIFGSKGYEKLHVFKRKSGWQGNGVDA